MKPHPPAWGLTGQENESITRHVKCCDEPADSGPEDETYVVGELTKSEEIILDTMHPIWFERKHGYHGMSSVLLTTLLCFF